MIPVFISHQGCPHQCVFCNQVSITGQGGGEISLSVSKVVEQITRQLAWPQRHAGRETQVAFYGGSFTGIKKALQERLLLAVRPFLENKQVDSIRVSTRPDYIAQETPQFLKQHGVSIVELGVQSLDRHVLEKSNRGHTVAQVEKAIGLLKLSGIMTGAQLMVGLPGEQAVSLLAGARRLAGLQPDFIRIYPTLVVQGSPLAKLYEQGFYRPMSLARAIVSTAKIWEIMTEHHIPVIRMGLQPTDTLVADMLAGPFHPAFGEVVMSRIMFKRIRRLLKDRDDGSVRTMVCAAVDQSIVRGQGNYNIKRLDRLRLLDKVRLLFQEGLERYSIQLI